MKSHFKQVLSRSILYLRTAKNNFASITYNEEACAWLDIDSSQFIASYLPPVARMEPVFGPMVTQFAFVA